MPSSIQKKHLILALDFCQQTRETFQLTLDNVPPKAPDAAAINTVAHCALAIPRLNRRKARRLLGSLCPESFFDWKARPAARSPFDFWQTTGVHFPLFAPASNNPNASP